MVVAEGHVHDGADDHLTVHGHGALHDVVHAQDGALRRIDDRRAEHAAEHTAIGNGEGTAGHLVDAQLAITCLDRQFLDTRLDLCQ